MLLCALFTYDDGVELFLVCALIISVSVTAVYSIYVGLTSLPAFAFAVCFVVGGTYFSGLDWSVAGAVFWSSCNIAFIIVCRTSMRLVIFATVMACAWIFSLCERPNFF